MPKIERWENLPEGVRQHLIDRMRDREIGVADLQPLRLWIETRPEVPEGDWYKDFGSFKICGRGSSPLGRNCRLGAVVCGMLVKQFKFKRNSDKGGFRWTAESAVETVGSYRGFHAVGRTLGDVKEFAALVRWCERTGLLERLSEMHLPGFESRMQTTWGGRNWFPHKRASSEWAWQRHAPTCAARQ